MFEKEAEEYGLQQALWCPSESGDLKDAFRDGAEFGYNKANEWHKMAELKTEEALKICERCREKQREQYPQSINCAFLHDNEFCSRIEDIDVLISKLFKK